MNFWPAKNLILDPKLSLGLMSLMFEVKAFKNFLRAFKLHETSLNKTYLKKTNSTAAFIDICFDNFSLFVTLSAPLSP